MCVWGFLGIALIPALDCFLACGMQNPWMWSRYSHSCSLSDRSEGGWGLRETAEVLSSHVHTHSMPPPPPATLTCTSYTTTNVLHRHQHAGGVVQELQCVLECVHVLTGMHTCRWLHMYMTSLDVCSQIWGCKHILKLHMSPRQQWGIYLLTKSKEQPQHDVKECTNKNCARWENDCTSFCVAVKKRT